MICLKDGSCSITERGSYRPSRSTAATNASRASVRSPYQPASSGRAARGTTKTRSSVRHDDSRRRRAARSRSSMAAASGPPGASSSDSQRIQNGPEVAQPAGQRRRVGGGDPGAHPRISAPGGSCRASRWPPTGQPHDRPGRGPTSADRHRLDQGCRERQREVADPGDRSSWAAASIRTACAHRTPGPATRLVHVLAPRRFTGHDHPRPIDEQVGSSGRVAG